VKVVVRGARRTGKTSLMHRLQGKPFSSEYTPSKEIDTAFINWTYKNSDDKIKVEVWDVVDTVLEDEVLLGKVDDDDAPAGALARLAVAEQLAAASLAIPGTGWHGAALQPAAVFACGNREPPNPSLRPPSCRLCRRSSVPRRLCLRPRRLRQRPRRGGEAGRLAHRRV
jgi:hypothetical protein